MRVALLAEFGAHEIYGVLARQSGDRELANLLANLHQEQIDVVASLRALILELGGRPKRSSLRRAILARVLALGSRPFGLRLPLRVCAEAEERRARWYGHFQEFLVSVGDAARAVRCNELQVTKIRHSNALRAWVESL
jgi:hypothetical protein